MIQDGSIADTALLQSFFQFLKTVTFQLLETRSGMISISSLENQLMTFNEKEDEHEEGKFIGCDDCELGGHDGGKLRIRTGLAAVARACSRRKNRKFQSAEQLAERTDAKLEGHRRCRRSDASARRRQALCVRPDRRRGHYK